MCDPIDGKFLDRRVPDHVCLRNLRLSAIIGNDAWNRRKAQPVVVSVKLSIDTREAASTDDIEKTVSYGQMCKDIMQAVEENTEGFPSILEFNSHLYELATEKHWGGSALQTSTLLLKGSLCAEGGICLTSCTTYHPTDPWLATRSHKFDINGLKIPCIIGVNAHERLEKQLVVVDITLYNYYQQSSVQNLTKTIATVVENSSYNTLEALAMTIVRRTLQERDRDKGIMDWVRVVVEKPNALAFVDGARVEITRRLKDFRQEYE